MYRNDLRRYCPRGCGKFYRRTSNKSIQCHFLKCPIMLSQRQEERSSLNKLKMKNHLNKIVQKVIALFDRKRRCDNWIFDVLLWWNLQSCPKFATARIRSMNRIPPKRNLKGQLDKVHRLIKSTCHALQWRAATESVIDSEQNRASQQLSHQVYTPPTAHQNSPYLKRLSHQNSHRDSERPKFTSSAYPPVSYKIFMPPSNSTENASGGQNTIQHSYYQPEDLRSRPVRIMPLNPKRNNDGAFDSRVVPITISSKYKPKRLDPVQNDCRVEFGGYTKKTKKGRIWTHIQRLEVDRRIWALCTEGRGGKASWIVHINLHVSGIYT